MFEWQESINFSKFNDPFSQVEFKMVYGPGSLTKLLTSWLFITVRNEVTKVMFLHLSVILFTGGRGLCLSVCCDSTHPLGPGTCPRKQTPPGLGTPPGPAPLGADTPPDQPPPWDQALPRSRHPRGPGPQQTATVADGTHPTGMHSCI